ncbi:MULTISPECIES: glycosyltransferase family 4 protein [Desulfococcus]|jgi:glycosyltransferase involved in cell wall biosynthesis|uniref:Glycosyl transferase group 1 n=1 Tax=Desulfococcus multivorans DSM 2059 TaxID=1121405 RepID=S7UYD0_DESML|nr:glycosyltransferase family 4 protein [Desulfococcus multivorans]AOY60313.1 glycosyltransferase, family I [Desulfococcus multivorans]AQV02419.1 glycosyl transferase family 1 [Desulfococcus multivorans]EPR39239.1 glycosyl transferase group 1 [Desulfococcus multivorans DSM 2059]MDX9819424.1 glycosyltransferase family 4 protein [Desulfococcus multivorans]SJZ58582.1 Glycosyltransferase involved in cell wall bisynthesis [Desulfococcus multivorans DSM 2059]
MRITLYAPFKPLDHPRPSGDLAIAHSLRAYLESRGHSVRRAGGTRMRWIYWRPRLWGPLLGEWRRALREQRIRPAQLWLTYHTYYKAPDLLGPLVCRRFGLPYVVFQGIFSTKRRRRLRTLPGYLLNRLALTTACHLFTNRLEDWVNLKRLVPSHRLTYIRPGISPAMFTFDAGARAILRREWAVGDAPVVLSAAMFRPGVKSEGLAWVIRSCGRLYRTGLPLYLVIAGDGRERERLRRLGERHLPGRIRFVGRIPREEMHRFYSAGDLFAFPGIRESLGMVYLESQSCGLPVAAFDNGGIPEVVARGETGLLTPPFDGPAFDLALSGLILDPERRCAMGERAREHVRRRHDIEKNYGPMEAILSDIAGGMMR